MLSANTIIRKILLNTGTVLWVIVAVGSAYVVSLLIQKAPKDGVEVREVKPQRIALKFANTDFGKVAEMSEFAWQFRVTNEGTESVQIKRVSVSCDCTKVSPETFLLAVGESVNLNILVDLTRREVSIPIRNFTTSFQLIAENSQGQESHTATITGQIHNLIDFDSKVLSLGEFSMLQQPLPAIKIPIKKILPTESLTAQSGGPWASRIVLEDSKSATIVVKSTAIIPEGNFTILVDLTSETSFGTATRRLAMNGHMRSDIAILPPQLVFGPATSENLFYETIKLRSRSNKRFRVEIEGISDLKIIVAELLKSFKDEVALSFSFPKAGATQLIGDIKLCIIYEDGVKANILIPYKIFMLSDSRF